MNKLKSISTFILCTVFVFASNFIPSEKVSANTSRIGGQNRYETSINISQNGWTSSKYVILASGQDYADALCAAPIANKYGAPILLIPNNSLDENVKEEITRLKADQIIEMGGPYSISYNVENQLKSMGLNVQRLGGADRYETSVIAAEALGKPSKVAVASGEGYADALSIAPIAARQGMPILLTNKNAVPETVEEYIDSNKSNILQTYVVGGNGVIPGSTLGSIPNVIRISGINRYETNVNVLNKFKSSIDLDNVYLSRGEGPAGNEFADALSASALAAKKNAPIILVEDNLNKNTKDFIKNNISATANIVAVGGQISVSDYLLTRIELIVLINGIDSRLQTIEDSTDNPDEKDAVFQIVDNLNDLISNKLDNVSTIKSNKEKIHEILQNLSEVERDDLQNRIDADNILHQYLDTLQQLINALQW